MLLNIEFYAKKLKMYYFNDNTGFFLIKERTPQVRICYHLLIENVNFGVQYGLILDPIFFAFVNK